MDHGRTEGRGTINQIRPDEEGNTLPKLIAMLVDQSTWRASASAGVTASVHRGVATLPLVNYGRYLPRLATGKWIGAFCLTEPNHGSDALSKVVALDTRAELVKFRVDKKGKLVKNRKGNYIRDDQGTEFWVLNGTKSFVTNGRFAKIFTVFAMTGSKDEIQKSAFIVERGDPGETRKDGIKNVKEIGKIGLWGLSTRDIIFENVILPKDRLLGNPGDGIKIGMSVLDHGRAGLVAGSWGLTQRIYDECLKWVTQRKVDGKFLADKGYDPNYGARPLKRLIQQSILDAIAKKILAGEILEGSAMTIDADAKGILIK